ncbi:MAG: DM13 domain-containing protein [Candidatus Liptonbacteria bacterium]|nr:DM13 domain-containing protein [Candidatus Liptonbacteria bacterium]
MARFSLSPKFIKEVIMLFRERSLHDIIFGKRVTFAEKEEKILKWIHGNQAQFKAAGGRTGHFVRIGPIHNGVGTVYVLPNKLGDERNESLVLFGDDTRITQGPDLWIYLSPNQNIKKEGLGDVLRLELIKGNKGGQTYVVKKPIAALGNYKSVVIWCKQFSTLFSFAPLS